MEIGQKTGQWPENTWANLNQNSWKIKEPRLGNSQVKAQTSTQLICCGGTQGEQSKNIKSSEAMFYRRTGQESSTTMWGTDTDTQEMTTESYCCSG